MSSESFSVKTEKHFTRLSDFLFSKLTNSEELNLSLDSEQSEFYRINQSQVRQNTLVDQHRMTMTYLKQNRKVSFSLMLTTDFEQDKNLSLNLIDRARSETQTLPEDPFATPLENHGESHHHFEGHLLSPTDCIQTISKKTKGSDFAGLYAGGPIIRASRNSLGQKHWFSTSNFFFDYSVFTTNTDGENKAVKGVYAGQHWSEAAFDQQIQKALNQISLLKRKSQKIPRGQYRTYLAPAAVAELFGTLSYRAFSLKIMKQGDSPLAQLFEGKKQLSPLVTIKENYELGLCPQFNPLGESLPSQLVLVENGIGKNMLTSTRSAKEFNAVSNRSYLEGLMTPEMNAGELKENEILKKLGTGFYIGNLHYLNWSENSSARITGMTRYACFWVENGEIVGPIQDLRFDDSVYRILGSQLEALTEFQEIDPNIDTYFQRSLGGKKLPGALIQEMAFTL